MSLGKVAGGALAAATLTASDRPNRAQTNVPILSLPQDIAMAVISDRSATGLDQMQGV
jgi:cephalosporin-C deacetylase-like acetyl esterase